MYNISQNKRERESGATGYGFVYQMEDLNVHVTYLMEEYIYENSEHCVNISSGTRMEILNAFKSRSPSLSSESESMVVDLITLFDEALRETVALLQADSLNRFYRTRTYKLMMSES